MDVTLIVFFRLGDYFNFDILKRKHAKNLCPPRYTATKKIFKDL
jgi:hypothetical protein